MSFEYNSVGKNVFLSGCFFSDSNFSLPETDQNFKIDGTIGYGNSCKDFLFRHLKIFRLHAKLHNAARAVRAESGKGPGYC